MLNHNIIVKRNDHIIQDVFKKYENYKIEFDLNSVKNVVRLINILPHDVCLPDVESIEVSGLGEIKLIFEKIKYEHGKYNKTILKIWLNDNFLHCSYQKNEDEYKEIVEELKTCKRNPKYINQSIDELGNESEILYYLYGLV